MDQLTGCTGGGEGGWLTCDWGAWFGHSAADVSRRGGGLGVGWECGFLGNRRRGGGACRCTGDRLLDLKRDDGEN